MSPQRCNPTPPPRPAAISVSIFAPPRSRSPCRTIGPAGQHQRRRGDREHRQEQRLPIPAQRRPTIQLHRRKHRPAQRQRRSRPPGRRALIRRPIALGRPQPIARPLDRRLQLSLRRRFPVNLQNGPPAQKVRARPGHAINADQRSLNSPARRPRSASPQPPKRSAFPPHCPFSPCSSPFQSTEAEPSSGIHSIRDSDGVPA